MAFNGQDFSFEGPIGSTDSKNDASFKKAGRGCSAKKLSMQVPVKHTAPNAIPLTSMEGSQTKEITNEHRQNGTNILSMMHDVSQAAASGAPQSDAGEAADDNEMPEPDPIPNDGETNEEGQMDGSIARISSVQQNPIPLVYDKYREAWRLRRGARQNNRKMEEVEWPVQSSICCWWCCHPFDTVPVPLPVHYDDRYDMFSVRGNFCSWGCAKAYALHNRSPLGNHSELLAMLRRRVEGKCMSIKAALDRSQLAMFGGVMGITEFRDASSTECKQPMISVKLSVSDYGLRSITQVRDNYETMQTNVNPTPFKDKGRKDMNFTNISISKNEPLKLKRNKPITGNKGKTVLEKVLGISITS